MLSILPISALLTLYLINIFKISVWNEVFCDGEWNHCDSCENAFSTPLVYEKGWGKKLTYCFSFGSHQVVDSTRRYTCDYGEVLKRRNLISEISLYLLLQRVNTNKRINLPMNFRIELEESDQKELDSLLSEAKRVIDSDFIPRQSGNLNWRLARREMG